MTLILILLSMIVDTGGTVVVETIVSLVISPKSNKKYNYSINSL